MIPTKQQWQELTGEQQAAYAAQVATVIAGIAAALAFVTTTVFSFFTLRAANEAVAEARAARADQAKMFMSEKAPQVEIKDAKLDGENFAITVTNIGDSSATFDSVAIDYPTPELRKDGKLMSPYPFAGTETLEQSNQILKGKTYKFYVANDIGKMQELFHFRPTSVRLQADDITSNGEVIGAGIVLHVNYRDSLQALRSTSKIIYLMQPKVIDADKQHPRNSIPMVGGAVLVPTR